MSETTSTDIRRGAKAVYLATSESVAQEIEQQLLAGADAMDRLAEAEAILPVCKRAIETAMSEAVGQGVTDWGAVNDALCKIDSFLSGGASNE